MKMKRWRRRGRSWRTPLESNGCAPKATRRSYESDDAALAALEWRLEACRRAGRDRSRFEPYVAARDGIKAQLEDLALFLRRYADGMEASPGRLQQVEERLALLERLKRKFGPTLARVIRDAMRCVRELADLEGGETRLEQSNMMRRVPARDSSIRRSG